jgi:mannan endo-1,4-beta-mannosidase
MKINKVFLMCFFGYLSQVSYKAYSQTLSDQRATIETVSLYNNLHILSKSNTLFGHQDDLAYGVNWKYKRKRSDIKEGVNDFPAVYGGDIAGIDHVNK